MLCFAFVIVTFNGFQFSTIFTNINKILFFFIKPFANYFVPTPIEGILIYGITKKPITIKPTRNILKDIWSLDLCNEIFHY